MSTNEKGTPQSRTYTVNDIAAILVPSRFMRKIVCRLRQT